LRSRASIDIAAKTKENPVLCSPSVNLLDNQVSGVDFTVKQIPAPTVAAIQNDDKPEASGTSVLEFKMIPIEHPDVNVEGNSAGRNLLTV